MPHESFRLPVGEFAPSTGAEPIQSMTVTVSDGLEDGGGSVVIAVGGEEIVDDLGAVLSFSLDAVFSRNLELVQRLVPSRPGDAARTPAANLFNTTFDAHRIVLGEEIESVRTFMASLLALERKHYVAAMQAIRAIVRSTQQAADEQTQAYVGIVAALESLSSLSAIPPAGFDSLQDRKKKLINEALKGADPELADRVRSAVVEAEFPGIRRHFVGFVVGSVGPEFFRSEAVGVSRPIRRSEFERAVRTAYDIRSRSVHGLRELAAETQALGQRTETSLEPGGDLVLTLDGLKRLAGHVVRDFVRRAPTGIDPEFKWDRHLPGMLMVQPAPQYWVWSAEGLDDESAARFLTGFVEHLLDLVREPGQPIADMRSACAKIEEQVPRLSDGVPRTEMVAIYKLWCGSTSGELHPENAKEFLNRHSVVLDSPGLASFLVAMLVGPLPDWSADEWSELAQERRHERRGRRPRPLPAGIDVALQVFAAEALHRDGRTEESKQVAAAAAEEAPGNAEILTWEAALLTGELIAIDMPALLTGVKSEDSEDEPDATETDGSESPLEPASEDGVGEV